MQKVVYYVRGGTHQGAYLTLRKNKNTKYPSRKYSWTNYKNKLVEMSYDAARHAAYGTYGGRIVKRIYNGKKIVDEVVV